MQSVIRDAPVNISYQLSAMKPVREPIIRSRFYPNLWQPNLTKLQSKRERERDLLQTCLAYGHSYRRCQERKNKKCEFRTFEIQTRSKVPQPLAQFTFVQLKKMKQVKGGVDTFIKFAKKMNGEQSPAIQEQAKCILLVALQHVTHEV